MLRLLPPSTVPAVTQVPAVFPSSNLALPGTPYLPVVFCVLRFLARRAQLRVVQPASWPTRRPSEPLLSTPRPTSNPKEALERCHSFYIQGNVPRQPLPQLGVLEK